MAGLVLNLKPYEKVLVGTVVLQNGDRRSQLRVVSEDVGVLRMQDALHPAEARTPLTRAYYAAQSIITGDAVTAHADRVLRRLLDEAFEGFAGFGFQGRIAEAQDAAGRRQYYRVLKMLKPLLAKERAVLIEIDGEQGAAQTVTNVNA